MNCICGFLSEILLASLIPSSPNPSIILRRIIPTPEVPQILDQEKRAFQLKARLTSIYQLLVEVGTCSTTSFPYYATGSKTERKIKTSKYVKIENFMPQNLMEGCKIRVKSK